MLIITLGNESGQLAEQQATKSRVFLRHCAARPPNSYALFWFLRLKRAVFHVDGVMADIVFSPPYQEGEFRGDCD